MANIALSALDEHFARQWQQMMSTPYRRAKRKHAGVGNWRIIRYADDFVVMVSGTRANAEALRSEVAAVIAPLGLRLADSKTQVVHIDDGFDFLGWRIQRSRKRGTNKRYVYNWPSKKVLQQIMARIRTLTCRNAPVRDLAHLLRLVNASLRGWCSYFRHGVSYRTFSYLSNYAWHRVAWWIRKRHPKQTWKRLFKRFYLPGPQGGKRPAHEGITLLYPDQQIPTNRYRYRGNKIPTPWATTLQTA